MAQKKPPATVTGTEKEPITIKLFDGVTLAKMQQRYEELGIKEHYKHGLKKDELIQRALKILEEIEIAKAAELAEGEEGESGKSEEEVTKQALLDAAEKEAKQQEEEAQALKDAEAKQEEEQKVESKSYADLLRTASTEDLKRALQTTAGNKKDALPETLDVLKKKYEAIEKELASRA